MNEIHKDVPEHVPALCGEAIDILTFLHGGMGLHIDTYRFVTPYPSPPIYQFCLATRPYNQVSFLCFYKII